MQHLSIATQGCYILKRFSRNGNLHWSWIVAAIPPHGIISSQSKNVGVI